jgi:hypothetical protein
MHLSVVSVACSWGFHLRSGIQTQLMTPAEWRKTRMCLALLLQYSSGSS